MAKSVATGTGRPRGRPPKACSEPKYRWSNAKAPRDLPAGYPFGGRVTETIKQFAERQGVKLRAMRSRAQRGWYPVKQRQKGALIEINLWALYLDIHREAERYMNMVAYYD